MQSFFLGSVSLAWVTLVFLAPLAAHDLPYGQVERAIQVTAYPDRIEVQYQFGMHERMVWEQLHGGERSEPWESLDREELAKLESDYLAKVASELRTWIALRVGGESRECTSLTTEMIYQHHLQFECRLVFPGPSSPDRTSLRLADASFSNFPGHYRVAVRGRGGLEAISDTAALLLVRAPRLPILDQGRGRLVVPPIEATLGQGLDREVPRLVEARVESEQEGGVEPSGQQMAEGEPLLDEPLLDEPLLDEKLLDEKLLDEKLLDESVVASRVKPRGADEVVRAEHSPRRLPSWVLVGVIVLAVIACLPLLWHVGQAV